MMSKEYCRYIRTYSELEGLQHAHTLVYCGAAAAQGVVMELRQEQDGRVRRSAVLLQDSLPGQCSCCATCVKQHRFGAVAGRSGRCRPEL